MEIKGHLISFPVDFKLSRFRIVYSHHIVVTVRCGAFEGIGSGVLYRSTLATIFTLWHSEIETQLDYLLDDSWETGWLSLIKRIIPIEPGLAFALDTAFWDLKGQQTGRSLADLLGGTVHHPLAVTEQIFIADWEQSACELAEIMSRGTKKLKVKTGFSLAEDIQLIRKVRELVGDDVEIRVDANRAYSLADSLPMYKMLADLGVLAVEEPLNNQADLGRFRRQSGLPVILDESILTLADLEEAIAAQAIDSLNIKLTRVGGISEAMSYRQMCEAADIAVSLGCNEDLGQGMAAILHMAAATPNLYAMEGIGRLRLKTDFIAEEMTLQNGCISLPNGNGLGVHLADDFPEHLKQFAYVFDLSTVSPGFIKGVSHFFRNRQRAATAVYRLQRRFQQLQQI
jgi:L-alanine-DL-glutamate epimerase-like enolase superfamily enzyme